jgi:hypothetical protein
MVSPGKAFPAQYGCLACCIPGAGGIHGGLLVSGPSGNSWAEKQINQKRSASDVFFAESVAILILIG